MKFVVPFVIYYMVHNWLFVEMVREESTHGTSFLKMLAVN